MTERGNQARAQLEREVAQRAVHTTAEHVRTTCSLARAERLLGREYHGRFLIELLQNAADAWREDSRSGERRSRLAIMVTDEPALLVANQGLPLTADVVISALGHIGASTKAEGEAIGYKGIGFKSVLEVTSQPEVYSALQSRDGPLALRFDPHAALATVRDASPTWDDLVAGVDNVDPADPRTMIPVLRYPTWVDAPPAEVEELAAAGYDTVVRLPHVADGPLSHATWRNVVTTALDELSDQILLLLDSFEEVDITDQLRHQTTRLCPDVRDAGVGAQAVDVHRNERRSSSWMLYRDRAGRESDLSGELAVGIRLATSEDRVVGAQQDLEHEGEHGSHVGDATRRAAPFHLFFPTRIASGTPFLLHGYFEVDASRTQFYPGSRERNERLLEELARLSATAVHRLLTERPGLARSLVNELAACPWPEGELPQRFRARLLDHLDGVAWIPAAGPSDSADLVRPDQLLLLDDLHDAAMSTFPPSYVRQRLERHTPDPGLDEHALALLRSRQGDARPDEFDIMEELLRPGELDVWAPGDATEGFVRLLGLLEVMRAAERERTDDLLGRLRGDSDARLIPAVHGGATDLRPVADPGSGRAGERSRVVMGRVRATDHPLTPPAALDVDFLPDGAFSEADIARAQPLGVRPFTVDSVLDRLGDLRADEASADVLRFVWRLLSREGQSSFSVAAAVPHAATFDPVAFFWCQPGRASDTDTGAPRQRRERNLTRLPVPCRDGQWRPAGEVALGADWADWIEDHQVGSVQARTSRVRALRALESLAPGEGQLLASPSYLEEVLAPPAAAAISDELDEVPAQLRLLAFLLRIGVWQVFPLEAWDDRSQDRPRFPWQDPVEQWRAAMVEQAGGWIFAQRPGRLHHNVWIGEDYRPRWSLEDAADRDAESLLVLLHLGVPLYRRAMKARVFCSGCSDTQGAHRARHESAPDDPFPSQLAVELHERRWVPATHEGVPVGLRSVGEVWWGPEPLGTSVVKQHPERFLERTDPERGMTAELRELVGLRRLDEAPVNRLAILLADLRERLDDEEADGSTASGLSRQAYVGLHRHIYRRLAELQPDDPELVAAALGDVGVLCERGNELVHVAPGEARHDDGTHAAHLRHFPDEVARVVLPRDADTTARRLGIPRLQLRFHRQGGDGRDVTAELEAVHHDRIPDLLAILVHHSLGAQTLEPTSGQFEERARRLQALQVRQVERLSLDVEVVDTGLRLTLGEQESTTYLEGALSATPVLYHDLAGVEWREELRPHLGRHVAAMVDNVAYEHTFELFFNRTTEGEREDFLLSLGVRPDDVDELRERIGAVSRAAQQRRRTWFAAVLACLGRPRAPEDVDLDTVMDALTAAGLDEAAAMRLTELGGDTRDRRDASDDGALRVLVDAGIRLDLLHDELIQHGDEGLALRVAADRFRRWRDEHHWTLIGLLARSTDGPSEARRRLMSLRAPSELRFDLDPPLADVLQPVVEELVSMGIHVAADRLADDPDTELVRGSGYQSADEMHDAISNLVDEATYERELRARATRWRTMLLDIAVLSQLTPAMTRTAIRALNEHVAEQLPEHADRPSELHEAVTHILPRDPELVDALRQRLDDDVVGPAPSIGQLQELLRAHGVPTHRLDEVRAARQRPRQAVERLQRRCSQLGDAGTAPRAPRGLQPPAASSAAEEPTPATGPRPVRQVNVDPHVDRRKKQIGDEAEQWALAAVLNPLLALDPLQRESALDRLVNLLRRHLSGRAVDQLVGHAEQAKLAGEDEEAFIEHATDCLHASQVSDAFGFDVLGWLPPSPDQDPIPLLLEVKSTTGGSFHLSTGEWNRARQLHDVGDGAHYAVLALTRAANGGPPRSMDLLCDPVALVDARQVQQAPDGFLMTYTAER
jgi:hypothetical protein